MKNNRYISENAKKIVQSEIRAMSLECEKIKGINLSQGICDCDVPDPVKQGAHEAIDQGINQYTRYDGLPELRNAIAKKLREYNNISLSPDKNIIISGGTTGAFYCACMALLNPGDEVILFEPYYGYHVNTLLAVRAKPVYVRLECPNWRIDVDALERSITPRTRGIMINTPSNPSGKVFSREELKLLADFSIRHDLVIFTDEIYEYFIYEGSHVSPASIPSIKDRTVTIGGPSKTYSITGWRIGYCACNEEWSKMIGYINDLIYVCGPAPLQMGVKEGITALPKDYYTSLCSVYKKKRDMICKVLSETGLKPYVPQGAYYVLADASSLPGSTSKEKAMLLLEKTKVASVPGSAFYHDSAGEDLLRFCFAKKDNDLDKACRNLLKLNAETKG